MYAIAMAAAANPNGIGHVSEYPASRAMPCCVPALPTPVRRHQRDMSEFSRLPYPRPSPRLRSESAQLPRRPALRYRVGARRHALAFVARQWGGVM